MQPAGYIRKALRKNADVCRAIERHVGPVKVNMLVKDDVRFMRVYKTDLLKWLKGKPDGVVYVEVNEYDQSVDGDVLYVNNG